VLPKMTSSDKQQKVTAFFNGYARDFYSIYLEQEKSAINRFRDRWFRASMFSRFATAYDFIKEKRIETLLNVGCGPGHHDILLAKGLGIEITGIDVAPNMVKIATENALSNKVDSLCKFHTGDFMQFTPPGPFDANLSLGVLEYISDPGPFIKRMLEFSKYYVIFSLPAKWHWLTPQRHVRYKLRNCPLYFYTENSIAEILENFDIVNYDIRRLGRDFLVILFKEN